MLMPSVFRNDFFDDDVRFPFMFPVKNHCQLMKTDVKDMDDHFELRIDLPGYSKDEIKAELKDGMMIVSAEKTQNKDEKDSDGNYIRRERYFGSCQRSFVIGEHVKEDDIKAEFKDGVLHLSIPKNEEKLPVEKKYISIEG